MTVLHEFRVSGEICFSEEHDSVYREIVLPQTSSPQLNRAPQDNDWSAMIEPNAVMLFRYSALTFNGHKIHYDRDYCRNVEGYEGLVVHGPLTATMMIGLVANKNPDRQIVSFEFRAIAPFFDTAPFKIAGRNENGGAKILAQAPDGGVAMEAGAKFA